LTIAAKEMEIDINLKHFAVSADSVSWLVQTASHARSFVWWKLFVLGLVESPRLENAILASLYRSAEWYEEGFAL
jgi:hypothetical protein